VYGCSKCRWYTRPALLPVRYISLKVIYGIFSAVSALHDKPGSSGT
jgi:hypothetical protein